MFDLATVSKLFIIFNIQIDKVCSVVLLDRKRKCAYELLQNMQIETVKKDFFQNS